MARHAPTTRLPSAKLALVRLEDRVVPAGWPLGIGGTGADSGRSVVTDGQGNVFVAGTFRDTVDFDPGPGAANLTSRGEDDGFLAKYSPAGELLWARRVGGMGFDPLAYAALDPAGNAYWTGTFLGTETIAGIDKTPGGYVPYAGPSLTSHNRGKVTDVVVAKLDPNGVVVWARQFGGDSGIVNPRGGVAIHAGTDGQADAVYVAGTFMGSVDFNPSPTSAYTLANAGYTDKPRSTQYDAFVVKLDAGGSFAWAARAGGTAGEDSAWGVAAGADGSAYVTGRFRGSNPFGPAVPLTSRGGWDGFVAKLAAASGATVWAVGMGGPGEDDVGDVGVYRNPDATESLYVTGGGAFVSKLRAGDGTFQWTTQLGLGGGPGSGVSGLAVDPSGAVYATGFFSGTTDFDPGPGQHLLTPVPAGSGNVFVSKLDAGGDFAWATRLGGPPDGPEVGDIGRGITADASGAVFLTGTFNGTFITDSGSVSSHGQDDAFVVKLGQETGGGLPLLAASGPSPSATLAPLTDARLQHILAAAIDRWASAGVAGDWLARLRSADVRMADLGGEYLGLADEAANAMVIDADAAGWGWFADPTPWGDGEFATPGDQGEAGRMDLLSALVHELGHLRGRDHGDGGVMAEALAPGVRTADAAIPAKPGTRPVDGTVALTRPRRSDALPTGGPTRVGADWFTADDLDRSPVEVDHPVSRPRRA